MFRAIFSCTLSPDVWSNLMASDNGLCSRLSPFIARILSPTCNAPVFSANPPLKTKKFYTKLCCDLIIYLQLTVTKQLDPNNPHFQKWWFPRVPRIYATQQCTQHYPGTNWHSQFQFFPPLKSQCRLWTSGECQRLTPSSCGLKFCCLLPKVCRLRVKYQFCVLSSPFWSPRWWTAPQDEPYKLKHLLKPSFFTHIHRHTYL